MIHNNATMLIKNPHVINAQSMLSSILECFVFTHSKSKADACTPILKPPAITLASY